MSELPTFAPLRREPEPPSDPQGPPRLLHPQALSDLLRRVEREWARHRRIFDLPERSFWRGSALDLSTRIHGRRAATPGGPAAGPHTQLAPNIAAGWLAGARVFELKTVQVEDRLRIPRPCIDAATVGFNVEWSQELALEESLLEYAKAWLLVHALMARNPAGLEPRELDTIFDVSVGYSLAGIRSDRVARWLDGLRDAGSLLARLRDGLAPDVRRFVEVDVPREVYGAVTLSTFHGCPPDEIERIAAHLFERHAVDVVVKLNPTLLGREAVEAILHARLGYDEIRIHRPAFEADLRFEDAVALLARLETAAARAGRALGVKLTNTLVVENHKRFFPESERLMYLSGAPLHAIAVALARRLSDATAHRYPLSFSAGIDRSNFAAAVGCGFAPVTACTDLLRPGGYARFGGYLAALDEAMSAAGARDVPSFIESRGGPRAALAEHERRVLDDPRYRAERNRSVPRRVGSALALFDCLSCDKCIAVCPNDALFAVELGLTGPIDAPDLVAGAGGAVRVEPAAPFALAGPKQIAGFADACNECGNCDVFCPETGGPYRVKPRFFASLESLRSSALDGFAIAPGRIEGRFDGVIHVLTLDGDRLDFAAAGLTARLERRSGRLLEAAALEGTPAGARLRLGRCHAMRALYEGVLAGVNPVSARFAE